MTDNSLFMQFMDIIDVLCIHTGIPVFHGVHIVDHAQIDIPAANALQKILERRFYIFHVPCTNVLTVLPGGADMSLYIHFIAAVFQCRTDDIARLRIRHPAVNNINALFHRMADQLYGFIKFMPFQPLAAKAYLTDHKFCFSKSS